MTKKGQMTVSQPMEITESRADLSAPDEGEEGRGNWGNQCDFFLSCLGYAVGLGNVWRFPSLCYKNGGGAFLIPYTICLFLTGLPLFFLELALGQYASLGPNIVFKKIAPIFQGLGYGMLVVTFLVVIYYNMIIAWTIFYTYMSFANPLPWTFCGEPWNTKYCYTLDQDRDCGNTTTYFNNSCMDIETFCTTNMNTCYDKTYKDCAKDYYRFIPDDLTHCFNVSAEAAGELEGSELLLVGLRNATKKILPTEEFFTNYMLALSPGFHDMGMVRWQLVLSLFIAWVVVCSCLIKGVQSSGKVVYFTALFPYVVLVIFLIRGLTLPGSEDGVRFFITPVWSKLKEASVWGDAATQIFYSLGPSFGGLITMASYNKFRNNCERDAIIVALANCCTSVFAGFAIFSIVGYMAHELEVPVSEAIDAGTGLAFIAYPFAITKLPFPPIWAIRFFVMLITLGLDSQFTMVETLTTAIMDQWPGTRKYKSYVVVGTCFIGFLLGLSCCTQGGVYMFNLLDSYSAGWSLLILSLTEIIVVVFIYGYDNFANNIKEMIGHRPFIYWQVVWRFITPLLLLAVLLFSWYNYTPVSYGDYMYPDWVNAIGWLMGFFSVIMIPCFGIYRYIQNKSKGDSWRKLFRPADDWGPAYKRAKLTPGYGGSPDKAYDNPVYREAPPPYNGHM